VDVVFYLTGDVLDIPGSPIFLLVLFQFLVVVQSYVL
jgi:hypothetical protein